jgi:hypothetical protein
MFIIKGYFKIVLIFIKFVLNEIKNNVNFKKYSSIALGNALILFIYFFPLKTSGSFFTTWNGSFFWFNLGLLLLMIKDEKNYK